MRKELTLPQRLLVILSGGVTLFLGLHGVLLCLITAFGLPADSLRPAGECLLYAFALSAAWGAEKRWARWTARLLPILLLSLLLWREYEAVFSGLFLCARQVTLAYARSLGFGSALDITPWVGRMTAGQEREAMAAAESLFLLAYGGWLGWLHLRVRNFWVTFLATFPLLAAPLAATITPDFGAIALLLLFWGGGLLTRLFARRDVYGGAKSALCLLPAGMLLLWGLSLLLPQDGYTRPPAMTAAREEALEYVMEAGRTLSGSFGDGQGWMGVEETVDLKSAGPLHYTGRIDLRVESETTGHIYLRGASQAVYTGESWEMLPDETYEETIWTLLHTAASSYYDPDGASDLNLSAAYLAEGKFNPLNFPALLREGKGQTRFVVENVAPGGLVFFPYDLVTTPAEMTGATFVQDAYLAREEGYGRYVLYAVENLFPASGGYFGGSSGNNFEARQAEQSYALLARTLYLQLPDGMAEELEPFLEEIGDAWADEFDAAQGVARYLEERAAYDLNAPKTPEGEDFALYFLRDSRRGYCMHFATAATLLLRAMGIPARYVSGYVADTQAGRTVDVPDSNAHAWVEIYCRGYGWYPVEVTPGFTSIGTITPASPITRPVPTPTPSAPPTPTPAPVPSALPAGEKTPEAEKGEIPWGLFAAVGLLLAVLALPLRRELAGRKRRRAFSQADVNRAVIELYGYREALLAFAGRQEEDAEVERLAKKAKFSQHTLSREELAYVRQSTEALAREIDRGQNWKGKLHLRYLRALY